MAKRGLPLSLEEEAKKTVEQLLKKYYNRGFRDGRKAKQREEHPEIHYCRECRYEKGGKTMTLEEAIKHCEEKAEELKHKVETWVHCPSDPNWEKDLKDFEDCKECAEEHEQLAKWLKELQTYKQKGCSYASKQRAYKEGKYDGFMESPYGD